MGQSSGCALCQCICAAVALPQCQEQRGGDGRGAGCTQGWSQGKRHLQGQHVAPSLPQIQPRCFLFHLPAASACLQLVYIWLKVREGGVAPGPRWSRGDQPPAAGVWDGGRSLAASFCMCLIRWLAGFSFSLAFFLL